MTTETSEVTGELLLNEQSKDDDNVNDHNNTREDDVISRSQDITTTISATPAEECESREKEETTEATEDAVFINHGLVRWEKVRREWLATASSSSSSPTTTTTTTAAASSSLSTVSDSISSSSTRTGSKHPKQKASPSSAAAIPLDVDEIIDLIFSQRWRSTDDERSQFPQPVPLPQMVDILLDLWEAEGLDI